MTKTQQAAKIAKEMGYTHIYSIVKTIYNTTYCHINDIDDVISNGWTAAPKRDFGWHGPVGVTANNLPTMSICKKDIYALLN